MSSITASVAVAVSARTVGLPRRGERAADLEERRPEVVAPLRDAVRLVDDEQADRMRRAAGRGTPASASRSGVVKTILAAPAAIACLGARRSRRRRRRCSAAPRRRRARAACRTGPSSARSAARRRASCRAAAAREAGSRATCRRRSASPRASARRPCTWSITASCPSRSCFRPKVSRSRRDRRGRQASAVA